MQDRIVVQNQAMEPLAFELALELATDFADILSVKEHDFALGDPERAKPLPPPVHGAYEEEHNQFVLAEPNGEGSAADAGDPHPARRDRGGQGRLPARARAAGELGAAARHRRLDRRRHARAAHCRAALRRGAHPGARVARRLAAARAADPRRLGADRPLVLPVRLRPRLPAHARRAAAPAGCPRPGCRGS